MEAHLLLEAARTPPEVDRVGDPERVTSVVVAYAPGPELIASVRSLAAQSWTNQEILLVDDGSPHGHDQVFRAAAELDPRVRLIRLPANVGLYAARNLALDRATGAYVTFQDPDAWSHPTRIASQVAFLRASAHAGVGCRAVHVTGDLTVTRFLPGPALVRRGPSSPGAGPSFPRFDEVRHGGDEEYAARLDLPALPDVLTLRRTAPSPHLSAALRSYRSAYRAWHRRPAASPCRPWPLLERRGRRAFDVLLVADWTRPDAGLGQLRALQARGMRVALLHLDDPDRLRRGPADLDPAVQQAINDGQAEQVDITDDVRVRLVVVRDPAVLIHPPEAPSGVRATRVVLETSSSPRLCADACRRLFHAEPLLAPAGPHTRRALAGRPLTPVDLPATVAADDWRLDRRAVTLPGSRPVAGLLGVKELPDADLDFRLLNGCHGVPERLRSGLVYRPADLDLRSFLHQLDLYLPLPETEEPADPSPAMLAALAAGCLLVLPPRYRPTFGDAAAYSLDDARALPTPDVVALRERGLSFVRTRHHHDRYAAQIGALTP